MQLRELTNNEFDNFSRNFNVFSMYQTKEYAFAMHNEGYETSTVGLFDNNELVGAALILIKEKDRKKFATIPRGYLVDYNDYNKLKSFTNLIKNFLEKRNVEAVKICPPIINFSFCLLNFLKRLQSHTHIAKYSQQNLKFH